MNDDNDNDDNDDHEDDEDWQWWQWMTMATWWMIAMTKMITNDIMNDDDNDEGWHVEISKLQINNNIQTYK